MSKSVAFYERGSWYHRTKELQEDYKVKYGKKGGFKTQEEAEASYKKYNEEYLKELTKRNLDNNQEVYLSDYLIYWFENIFKKKEVDNNYIVGVAYIVYNLIIPFLKQENVNRDIKLKLVNTTFLDSLLEELAKTTNSAGEKCQSVLNIAMQDAIKKKYISYNPMDGTKKYERKKPKITILNKEQLKKLLKTSKIGNWYLEILLGVFCGLRKGEIMGLKFKDYDKEKRIIRIKRQLVVDPILAANPNAINVKVEKYTLTEKPPKGDSYRNLRVPRIIIEELERRQEELTICRMVRKNFANYDYINFNRKTGKPQLPGSLNSYLNAQCHKAGIPTVTVHGLRHIFATILIENGVPLIKISAIMGHDSPNTTFEIYCDVMDERDKILAFINNTFSTKIIEEVS